MIESFKKLPQPFQLGLCLCFALAAFVAWKLSYWWDLRPDYAFGYLAPLFSLFVIYERLDAVRKHFEAPTPAQTTAKPLVGLANLLFALIFLGAICSYLLGAIIVSVEPSQPGSLALAFGFAWMMLAIVFFNSKRSNDGRLLDLPVRIQITAAFIFPAFIWLISAPLLSVIEDKISYFLLGKVTVAVLFIADLSGVPIVRESNVLIMPDGGRVGVEDACSGIRSLTACLFAGSFLAAVFLQKWWAKVTLIFAALCLAFLTNLGRSLFLTTWAYLYGAGSIEGTVHDITGYAVLGITTCALLGFCLVASHLHDATHEAPPS